MHTTINKHPRKAGEHVVNSDGMVWTVKYPKHEKGELDKIYKASIPDKRIDHFDFDCFGYHKCWADTIDELIDDIKSLDAPYYSEDNFLNKLREADKDNVKMDRQVTLHWDGRGANIVRGEFNFNNMTAYTSF
jgi:hypothetical protein